MKVLSDDIEKYIQKMSEQALCDGNMSICDDDSYSMGYIDGKIDLAKIIVKFIIDVDVDSEPKENKK